MATMILAVMTRATLGHTGRELIANAPTTFLYMLVTLGALLRVASPLGLVDYRIGMEAAAVAWAGAFILFLGAYGPILFRPRVGRSLRNDFLARPRAWIAAAHPAQMMTAPRPVR